MIEGLMKKPSIAVPMVLRRLRAKLDEWREAQKNYNRLWREQCDKNHTKWQQSQAATFRQVDGRQMRTKTLLNEADTAAEEVGSSWCYCCTVSFIECFEVRQLDYYLWYDSHMVVYMVQLIGWGVYYIVNRKWKRCAIGLLHS